MSISDPISDMLTRIRNAGKSKINRVDIPGSKLKYELAKVLKSEGYIRNYKVVKDDKQGILRVYLKYDQRNAHVILDLKRVSKPSRRIYVKRKNIKSIYNGLGVAILSTSKGVMSDRDARKWNLGGEILCQVW
ncbi:MAG: 30S ribosomal protein S8 [Desulfobacterales bacterium]|nr:30S ribosomal protein S8 [Desulfobacterales bacterium]